MVRRTDNGMGEGLPLNKVRKALWWWHLSSDLNRERNDLCSCQGDFSWHRISRCKGPEVSAWCVQGEARNQWGKGMNRGWGHWAGAEPCGDLGGSNRVRPLAFPLSEMGSSGIVTWSDLCFNRVASFSSFLCSFCKAHQLPPCHPLGWVTLYQNL